MNPNYLEYDSLAVKTVASTNHSLKGFSAGIQTKSLFIHLVAQKTALSCKQQARLIVASHRVKRFISRYNSFIDLLSDAKKEGYIGKYTKHCIYQSNGKKRIVFNPEPRFKKLLKAFNKVLEAICFTEFSGRYKSYKMHRQFCTAASHQLYKGKQITPFRFILPHKVSIDTVLCRLAVWFKGCHKPSLIKLDLKDAYQSTSETVVRGLLAKRLNNYGEIYDFILDNLGMCFIDGKLPPGYPTSSVLFHLVKDQMFVRHTDKTGYIRGIESYADDIYVVVDKGSSEDTPEKLLIRKRKIDSLIKYMRKWGYRINQKKTDYIPIFAERDSRTTLTKLSNKASSKKILGKCLKYNFSSTADIFTWQGTRKNKNKLRMLNYLIEKEKQGNLGEVDPSKDNARVLEIKKKSFENFYFPSSGSIVYS